MVDIFEKRPEQTEALQFLDDADSGYEITEWCLANGATAVWYDDQPYQEPGLRVMFDQNSVFLRKTDWLMRNKLYNQFTPARDEYFQAMWKQVDA